jgi:dTDP-4-dehydrorhamnose reductase
MMVAVYDHPRTMRRSQSAVTEEMKIVILGTGGRLGAALMRKYRDKFDLTGFDRAQLDLSNLSEIRRELGSLAFDLLINTAAFTNVDLCETEREQAFLVNAEAPGVLAEICRDKKAKLIHFSTDYVFDGEKREPYVESDPADPISVYGESKREGEKLILQTHERNLVVRVSWVFGPDRPSFVDSVIARARESEQLDAIADKFSTPTYTRDIEEMLPHFFDANSRGGIVHFTNAGECSWQQYAQHALDCCHQLGVPLRARTVAPLQLREMKHFVARRPVYSVLATAKYTNLSGMAPRSWRDAVADYVKSCYSRK